MFGIFGIYSHWHVKSLKLKEKRKRWIGKKFRDLNVNFNENGNEIKSGACFYLDLNIPLKSENSLFSSFFVHFNDKKINAQMANASPGLESRVLIV